MSQEEVQAHCERLIDEVGEDSRGHPVAIALSGENLEYESHGKNGQDLPR